MLVGRVSVFGCIFGQSSYLVQENVDVAASEGISKGPVCMQGTVCDDKTDKCTSHLWLEQPQLEIGSTRDLKRNFYLLPP